MLTLLMSACSQQSDTKTINQTASVRGLPEELHGVELIYTYDNKGNAYHVKMDETGLRYRYRTGSNPKKWWGPFDYNVLKTNKGDYVIGWYEKGYGDYITLTVDFEAKTLIGSGIVMPSSYIHFDRATIEKFIIDGKEY